MLVFRIEFAKAFLESERFLSVDFSAKLFVSRSQCSDHGVA